MEKSQIAKLILNEQKAVKAAEDGFIRMLAAIGVLSADLFTQDMLYVPAPLRINIGNALRDYERNETASKPQEKTMRS